MMNEAGEEDAEGMLRPKPKEQPMSKLCEAWATAARLEETCERSGGQWDKKKDTFNNPKTPE